MSTVRRSEQRPRDSTQLGDSYHGARIRYSLEETPLDTGGRVLVASNLLNSAEPFLLLNGDTYFPVRLAQLRAFAEAKEADWTFSLFRTAEGGRYIGMTVGTEGEITSLDSENNLPRLAHGGVYWMHPGALANSGFSIGERVFLESWAFERHAYSDSALTKKS